MTLTGKSTSLLYIVALFIVVSLVGCAANSPTQVASSTNTPAPQTIEATPTAKFAVTINTAEEENEESTGEANQENDPSQVASSTNTSAPQTIVATPTAKFAVKINTADEEAEESTGEANQENDSSVDTATCTKLNLNTLTQDQLLSTIPNFSSRMVREFFEYRPYVSIQQFRREIGKYVDDAQVAQYEQYVFVPVDPNSSDADTLKQIPGVDDTLAASLIAGRPYASNQAFLDVLSKSLDVQQLAEAGCYLVTSA